MRADGVAKVTGEGTYTADISFPGMGHAQLLIAGRPHARILRLSCERARQHPGVMAVLTHDDVPPVRYGQLVRDRTLFAGDVVRYEGEIVAAVVATSIEVAREAVSLIEVEYEDLEPVTDPRAALAASSALVHPEWEEFYQQDGIIRDRNVCGYADIQKGDVAAGLERAEIIRRDRYVTDMSHPLAIEPHAVVARWEGPNITIWSTTQVPFAARAGVAEALGLRESRVRVIVPHLGGGFGGKCEFHSAGAVAALARAAGRPVRLVLNRREEFIVPNKTGIR